MKEHVRRFHRHDSVLLRTVACGGSSLSLSRIFTFQPCACAQKGSGSSYGISVYVLQWIVKRMGHFYQSPRSVVHEDAAYPFAASVRQRAAGRLPLAPGASSP